MASQTFQMVMQTGPTPLKSFTLSKQEIILGRDANADIVINVAEVSRRHTRLHWEANAYIVEDLGSTNGTFVNGSRLTGPVTLHPGDVVHLGEAAALVYKATQFDPNATIVAPAKQNFAASPTAAPPSAPAFAGNIPASPTPADAPLPQEKPSRPWLWAGIGCLGLIICMVACCTAPIVLILAPSLCWCIGSWYNLGALFISFYDFRR